MRDVVEAKDYDALLAQAEAMADELLEAKEVLLVQDQKHGFATRSPVKLSPVTQRASMALEAWQKFKEQK